MPTAVDKLNLANELKGALAGAVLPLLKAGISETEANGFLVWASEVTAEIAITGEYALLEEIQELIPLKVATYGLRAAATANAAIANVIGIVAKAARIGLLAVSGPLGVALQAAAGAVTPPPADPS